MSMTGGLMNAGGKLLPPAGFLTPECLMRNTWSLVLGGCLLFWTAVATFIYLV